MSRFEQKQSYQPNVIKAWVVVGVITLAVISYIHSLDNGNTAKYDSDIGSSGSQDAFVVRETQPNKRKQPSRQAPGYNPYAVRHMGFLGFINPSIVADKADELIDVRPFACNMDDTLAPFVDELILEDAYGDGDGYGGDIFEYDCLFSIDEQKEKKEPVDRPITVVYAPRPEYPGIARLDEKGGVVKVLLKIDETGKQVPFVIDVDGDVYETTYFVAHEEPKGYYFADKVLKVLPQWAFSPCIENGVPTHAFQIITYIYCLGNDCLGYWLEMMDDNDSSGLSSTY